MAGVTWTVLDENGRELAEAPDREGARLAVRTIFEEEPERREAELAVYRGDVLWETARWGGFRSTGVNWRYNQGRG